MIEIYNGSSQAFTGWKRLTVRNEEVLHKSGSFANGYEYVVGRSLGTWGKVLDVYVQDLPPNTRITLDPSTALASVFKLTLPSQATMDPIGYFGIPTYAGVPLSNIIKLEQDGAALSCHFRQRIEGIVYDLRLLYYPDMGVMPGVLSMTYSDSRSTNLTTTCPKASALSCGASVVTIASPGPSNNISDYIGDGQRINIPITIDFYTADTGMRGQLFNIHGKAIQTIGQLGKPVARNWNPAKWEQDHSDYSTDNVYSRWLAGSIGWASNSTNTGAQEDQGFYQGFESFYPIGSLKHIAYRTRAAYRFALRPFHHLNVDGTPVDPTTTPNRLIYWQGRPHFNKQVSPDQRGKLQSLNPEIHSHNWYGPDREHCFINTLSAAYELNGCATLQDEFVHLAYIFLGSETTDPSISTSGPDAARSAGWTGLQVSQLIRHLEDRQLAERVAQRWKDRVTMVYGPAWLNRTAWDVRHTAGTQVSQDISLTYFWMPYQQAVGSFGMYMASKETNCQLGIEIALRGARAVVEHAYQIIPEQATIREWEILGTNYPDEVGGHEYIEGHDAHRTGWYSPDWLAMAVWVCLQGDPSNQKALAIWSMLLSNIDNRIQTWLPPTELG